MTKEKLYTRATEELGLSVNERFHISTAIDEFFESNVCIPKGENRHPYADVLHEWVEDTSNKLEYFHTSHQQWMGSLLSTNVSWSYRIKPSESVHEYQWAVVMDDNTASVYGFHTEKSINEIFPDKFKFKIQNSQRVRQ